MKHAITATTAKALRKSTKGRPNMMEAAIGPAEQQLVDVLTELKNKPEIVAELNKTVTATTAKKEAASAKRVQDDVARQLAEAAQRTKPLNQAQTKVMAESLDVAPTDVKNHVQEVTGYQGPMLALRDRLKAGQYKKAANGQPSCGDAIAQILGQLEPAEVIHACLTALDIANPYTHLNVGQQSMNLRNKLRGALKHEKFGMGVLKEAVEDIIEARPAATKPE